MRLRYLVALESLVLFGVSCAAIRAPQPNYVLAFNKPNIDCVEVEHVIGKGINEYACPQKVADVTETRPCDETLWGHIYHPKRLVVKRACISVTGALVDASHGRNRDGCRHEADGDCHTWLKLDANEESLLNAKNRSNEAGNLVIEPICRYRVTQADAVEACRDWHQDLILPPPGSRVRVTGAYVFDSQHGHMEIHPITAVELIK